MISADVSAARKWLPIKYESDASPVNYLPVIAVPLPGFQPFLATSAPALGG